MGRLNWTWIITASICILMLPVLILLWPLTLMVMVIGLRRRRRHHQGFLPRSAGGINAITGVWSSFNSVTA